MGYRVCCHHLRQPPPRRPRDCCAIDARHGRVVLNGTPPSDGDLVIRLAVWDPVTDEQMVLPKPPTPPDHVFPFSCTWTAAVLCATAGGGCNNDIDCHHGSFLVVFLCTGSRETFTCVYSSDSGAWSGPTSVLLRHASVTMNSPSVLVGNALYYISDNGTRRRVLKHDLSKQETSLIHLPRTPYKDIVLTAMTDGVLGFAAVHESKMYLWSRVPGPKAYAGWKQSRVLELDTLLQPIVIFPASFHILSLVDGITAVFRGADAVFIMNLVTRRVRILCQSRGVFNIVPYMSFYTTALKNVAVGDGPGTCASTA